MSATRLSARYTEHSPNCLLVVEPKKEECNCFLSLNEEQLSKIAHFQPATEDGPPGILGQLGQTEEAAIQNFVAQKLEAKNAQLPGARTNELYGQLEPGEIRILELHPEEFAFPLRGTLHVVNIDFNYPPVKNWTRSTNHGISLATGRPFWYTALSYVWGPPKFDNIVHIEKHSVWITSTLEYALRQLRSKQESVFLWVDQICVNQYDTRDKEQQIPLMGLIYSHATNTLIWLGDDGNDNPALAFDTLHTIFSRLQFSEQGIDAADFERLHLPKPANAAWSEIRRLLGRWWFTRLWTIQEAVLSRSLFIRCGRATESWDDFASWCTTLQQSGILDWIAIDGQLDGNHVQTSMNGLLQSSRLSTVESLQQERIFRMNMVHRELLLNVLASTRYAQATEPKDKIYGVLGIADSDIKPNYSDEVSARDVYWEACLTQLPEEIHRLLCCVDHDMPLEPSWVPDWSSPRATESLGFSTKSWALYSAGGNLYDSNGKAYPIRFQLNDNKKRIALYGKIFDTISTLGAIAMSASIDIDEPSQRNTELASYVDIAKPYQQYTDGSSTFDAFWQTLVAGKDGSGIAKAPQDYNEVFSLIIDSTTGRCPSLPGQVYSPRRKKGFFTLDSLHSRKPQKTLEDMRRAFRAALQNRRFAVTEKGYFALVPRGTAIGDSICVFERGNVPFMIRTTRDGGDSQILGECYVHGIMQGQVMDMEEIEIRSVTLV